MKVLTERCKKHGLDVKSTAVIELPFGTLNPLYFVPECVPCFGVLKIVVVLYFTFEQALPSSKKRICCLMCVFNKLKECDTFLDNVITDAHWILFLNITMIESNSLTELNLIQLAKFNSINMRNDALLWFAAHSGIFLVYCSVRGIFCLNLINSINSWMN